MSSPTKPARFKSAGSKKRDSELVENGLQGCLHIANSLAYRYYRHQLVLQDDREQAAALAALETYAAQRNRPGFTLREATKSIRSVLYRQTRAYGYRMKSTRQADGSRTSGWVNCEIPFSQLPDLNYLISAPAN